MDLFLGMVFMCYSMPLPPNDFNANHPFMFYLVSHDAKCEMNVLFGGRVIKATIE